LAKKGFNIFLASRTPEKLGKVAGEIGEQRMVEVWVGVGRKCWGRDLYSARPSVLLAELKLGFRE